MPLYYFDTRDGETFIKDDVGLEFPNDQAVRIEAARALLDLARDVAPGCVQRHLAVEVGDDYGPVLVTRISFEAVMVRQN